MSGRFPTTRELDKLRTLEPELMQIIDANTLAPQIPLKSLCELAIEKTDLAEGTVEFEYVGKDANGSARKSRTERLTDPAVRHLKNVIGDQATGFVFRDRDGNTFTHHTINRQWDAACRRADLPPGPLPSPSTNEWHAPQTSSLHRPPLGAEGGRAKGP